MEMLELAAELKGCREQIAAYEVERAQMQQYYRRAIADRDDAKATISRLRAELAELRRFRKVIMDYDSNLYDALANSDALERAPRWRDVVDELPTEAQEVLFVRGGKTVHGAWIGGIFWHNNQKMAASYWMPLPLPPNDRIQPRRYGGR